MTHKVLLFLLVTLLTGCTASRSVFDRRLSDTEVSSKSELVIYEDQSQAENVYEEFEQALRSELEPWKGTRHVLGGTSLSGIDCSGLIMRVFGDLLQFQTGRTTEQLIKLGKRIRRSELRPGDLVFFSPSSKKGGHVGIYLSDGEFTHVSSSRGVMTSALSNPYWKRYYETSRRIITDEEGLRNSIRSIRERQKLAQELQSE
jgi:cell wall-associated NlpC family hydrolase